MKILIVTGLSGAGKTQVIKALEDIGFIVLTICRRSLYQSSLRYAIRRQKKWII